MYWNFGSKLLIWNITGVGKVGGGICGEVSQETGDNFRYPSAIREPGGAVSLAPPASLTRAVWNGPDEGGQHLHRGCGVGVLP